MITAQWFIYQILIINCILQAQVKSSSSLNTTIDSPTSKSSSSDSDSEDDEEVARLIEINASLIVSVS